MRFTKYHALGNDYIVMEGAEFSLPTPDLVRTICHRNFGVGSDGILLRVTEREEEALKIFNPDGSEAEKSGNGLRIFARYLWDEKLVTEEPFKVITAGGIVTCQVSEQGHSVTVDMGSVRFASSDIPVAGPFREVIDETLEAGDRTFTFTAATIGNPHCVILLERTDAELAHRYGPLIERHPLFLRRTNVQFAQVLDRSNMKIEIWERGAGYTLASGSSSCAAAAVAYKHRLVDSDVTVHMPGGTLRIEISPDLSIRMTGPVVRVAGGAIYPECLPPVAETTQSAYS